MDPTTWHTPFWITAAALFCIVMARANGTYWLGRATARGLRRTGVRRLMESPGYLRAHSLLDRWGAPLIALSFLTVGFQTLVNLAAGAVRMSLRSYLPAVVVGSVMWALLYAVVGTASVTAWLALYERAPLGAIALAVVLLGALAGFLFVRLRGDTESGA